MYPYPELVIVAAGGDVGDVAVDARRRGGGSWVNVGDRGGATVGREPTLKLRDVEGRWRGKSSRSSVGVARVRRIFPFRVAVDGKLQ